MANIEIKSPTRVDLAGGTLDCWPLYLFLNDPVTINVAIDIFTYVELRPRSDRKIIFNARDMQAEREYRDLDECLKDTSSEFSLLREHVRYWRPKEGFELHTRSESPVGGGLGGSSSLCVSILKAFLKWMGREMTTSEMVRLCSHIEARVLEKPTGSQDYFPPILGGINILHYEVAGPRAEVLPLSTFDFADRFVLAYTGRTHNSGINNWQVIKNYLDGDEPTKKALRDIADISRLCLEAVRARDSARLAEIFDQEFEARVRLTPAFSSPEILKLRDIARPHGASAKICGAGGGGCVLLWCKPGTSKKVVESVEAAGFKVLSARPWESLV